MSKNLHLLEPLLFALMVLAMNYGMLFLPEVIPKFFEEQSVGHVYAVLYPTYLCNRIIAIGTIVCLCLLVIADIVWLKHRLKSFGHQVKRAIVLGVCISIWIPCIVATVLLSHEELSGVYEDFKLDIIHYKAGEVLTYYGPLERSEQAVMRGTYRKNRRHPIYLTQVWRGIGYAKGVGGAGETFELYSSLGFAKNFYPEADKEYKVTYLPKTRVICDIEVFDRWGHQNQVLQSNILGQLAEGWGDEPLVTWVRSEASIPQDKPQLIFEYARVDLDHEDDEDYVIVLQNQSQEMYQTYAVRNMGDLFEVVFMPIYLNKENVIVDLLESMTYGLHDFKMTLQEDEVPMILRYDGVQHYEMFESDVQ
ncbi:MAG: hypothetical protein ACRCTE_01565 [Cellulosilyticaceae bacterium]